MKTLLWVEDLALDYYKETYNFLHGEGIDPVNAKNATEAIIELKRCKFDYYVFDLIIGTGDSYTCEHEEVGIYLLLDILQGQIENVLFDPKKVLIYSVIAEDDNTKEKLNRYFNDQQFIMKKIDSKSRIYEKIIEIID